jgi:hypothetical protein
VSAYAMMVVELNKTQETLVKESIELIEKLYIAEKKQPDTFVYNKEAKLFFTESLLKRLRNSKNGENHFYANEKGKKVHPVIVSSDEDNFATKLSRKARAVFGRKTVTYYLELDLKNETWRIYHIELPNGIEYY